MREYVIYKARHSHKVRIQWRPLWDQAKQWLLGLKIICRGRLRQLPQGQGPDLRTNLAALGLWIFQGAKPLTDYRYFTVRMLLSELLDNLRLLDYITAAALHFNVQKVGTTRILGLWHPCAIYKHHWVRFYFTTVCAVAAMAVLQFSLNVIVDCQKWLTYLAVPAILSLTQDVRKTVYENPVSTKQLKQNKKQMLRDCRSWNKTGGPLVTTLIFQPRDNYSYHCWDEWTIFVLLFDQMKWLDNGKTIVPMLSANYRRHKLTGLSILYCLWLIRQGS